MTVFAAFFTVWPQVLPSLLDGLLVALKLTGVSLLIGFPFGLALAITVSAKNSFLRGTALVVVEVGRGAPTLVILEIIYFGLPQAHITLSQFLAAAVAYAWAAGAYSSEILRASIEAVPHGQREASAAVGLDRADEFRFVILPQAIRTAIPPLMSLAIQIFQLTSLAFAIALPEIMSRAYEAASVTFLYLDILLLAAALYCAVCLPASMLVGLLEKRLARHLDPAT